MAGWHENAIGQNQRAILISGNKPPTPHPGPQKRVTTLDRFSANRTEAECIATIPVPANYASAKKKGKRLGAPFLQVRPGPSRMQNSPPAKERSKVTIDIASTANTARPRASSQT